MPPKSVLCPFCKTPIDAERMARATADYSPSMHLHVSSCPNCAQTIEYRARSGGLEIGYTYWAGSMHFEAVALVPLRGFGRLDDSGALRLKDEQIYTPPRPS